LDQHSQNHLASDLLGYAVLLLSSSFTGPAGNSGLVELAHDNHGIPSVSARTPQKNVGMGQQWDEDRPFITVTCPKHSM
jgi:hypothetical protein